VPATSLIIRNEALRLFTPDQIRARLDRQDWQQIFAGVYAMDRAPLDAETRIRAALLASTPAAVAIRESAATIHGFGVLRRSEVQLGSLCTETARTVAGIRMHAVELSWSDTTAVRGLRCTTAARTAIDLARVADRLDGLPVLDAALRVGACSRADLSAEVERQRGLRGIVRARGLVAVADAGAESPMESRTRLRIIDADFPPPQLQVPVGPYRLDLGWDEAKIGVEYDGIVHVDRAQQRWDLERRRYLLDAGWTVLTVTDLDVYRRPGQFLAQLKRAFAASVAR
jgi:very-short-patch-repair endonuclease